MTNRGSSPRKRHPFLRVKHGSAVVPIYKGITRNCTRYTVAFWMDGKRHRRTFGNLDAARAEAQLIARRVQSGLAATNDLSPSQRERFLAASRMADEMGIPLLSVVEEYKRSRQLLGNQPVLPAVQEFLRRSNGLTLGVKVSDLFPEFLKAKQQDGISRKYYDQLNQTVRRFSQAFPGEILAIKAGDIDRWLRGLGGSPVTRNSIHRCIKVFFSFAKSRSCLPASEATAPEMVNLAKVGDTQAEIFEPSQLRKLLETADARTLPYLLIGAFAGLRTAEIKRLGWDAVDLDRRIITLRADQAKTASRRIVPISDNLHAWLSPIKGTGQIVATSQALLKASSLAKNLGIKWPHNGLRHSYISYRIADIKDAARVALEAGNSPEIIFRHYRELVTEHEAREWFSIMPPDGWSPPASSKRRYCRKQKANA